MPDKRPKGTHNPSLNSLRRWDNEGGAPIGGRHPKRPRDINQWAKHMVDLATGEAQDPDPDAGKSPAAREFGHQGGKARAEKTAPERRSEIARDAARKRWSKR